jgi:hypothetical protein
MLAGIVVDPSIERVDRTVIVEARDVPRSRHKLTPKDEKTLAMRTKQAQAAIKHLDNAVKALEKIPSTDFMGDIPHFINEIEYVLHGEDGNGGLRNQIATYQSDYRSWVRKDKSAARQAEEEEALAMGANDINAEQEEVEDENPDDLHITEETTEVKESVHFYNDNYSDFEKDDTPINVVDGNANDEQVWDGPMDPENSKDESPNQLRSMDQQDNSPQDKSGDDLSTKVTVPTGIKQALKAEIDEARREAKKLDVRDRDAARFYEDLANAFEEISMHLEKGTRYDIKQAQIFAQTLMGPMLHKIPTNVWKFIINGGEPRSLKSFMKEVK